jgi:LysM repeat protein
MSEEKVGLIKPGWTRAFVLWLLLLLAGCFQQAGESLQSIGPTSAPFVQSDGSPTVFILATVDDAQPSPTPETLVIVTVAPTSDILIQTGPISPTVQPITIIVPTATNPLALSATPFGFTPPAATQDSSVTFITPGSPLGPNLAIATATGFGAAATNNAAGLVTPTALGDTALDLPGECIYTVESGDTVYRIALSFDTTVEDMQAANPDLTGTNPVIHPGDELIIPNCVPGEGGIAVTATPVAPIINPVGQPTSSGSVQGGQIYIVKSGDTLFTIAQRFGLTVAELVEANNITDPNRLALGQELVIPPSTP